MWSISDLQPFVAWRDLVIWSVVMTISCSYSDCHAVTRVHTWFMIKGSQTGFLQEFQKSQHYRSPLPGLNLSSVNQCSTYYDKSRRGGRKRTKRSRSKKWLEKSLFSCTFDVAGRASISFFVVLCLRLLGIWAEGRKGVFKNSPLSLAQDRGSQKGWLLQTTQTSWGLDSHKGPTTAWPAPGCGVSRRWRQGSSNAICFTWEPRSFT